MMIPETPHAPPDGRFIAVLADIHANREALKAVLADLDAWIAGMPPGTNPTVVALGDMIGYGGDPAAVLAMVRDRGMLAVMGNHEKGAIDAACRRACFHQYSREALMRTRELLSGSDLDSLSGLPTSLVLSGLRFVHGMPPDDPLTYLVTQDDDELRRAFAAFPERVCFVGHSHVLEGASLRDGRLVRFDYGGEPFWPDPAARHILCCGSVGQPRDGDNRAKYVLIDTEAHLVTVRRVPYDIAGAAARIIERGLPRRYADRLW